MKAVAWALVLATLLVGCADAGVATNDPSSPTTTVYRIDGLECRVDSFESAMVEIAADAEGAADPVDEVAAFLELPVNRRFSDVTLSDRTGLRFSFADEDGLVQLVIQLIDASRGYVVGSYSYCVDGR